MWNSLSQARVLSQGRKTCTETSSADNYPSFSWAWKTNYQLHLFAVMSWAVTETLGNFTSVYLKLSTFYVKCSCPSPPLPAELIPPFRIMQNSSPKSSYFKFPPYLFLHHLSVIDAALPWICVYIVASWDKNSNLRWILIHAEGPVSFTYLPFIKVILN